jgi:GNAT superfamily N-acetyltransferase
MEWTGQSKKMRLSITRWFCLRELSDHEKRKIYIHRPQEFPVATFQRRSVGTINCKKLPRYPVPCFRMGRLACRSDRQGQGLGKLLVGCAVERCLQAHRLVGAFALLVDAKDEKAKAFYQHYGWIPCVDSPMTLYLPLR